MAVARNGHNGYMTFSVQPGPLDPDAPDPVPGPDPDLPDPTGPPAPPNPARALT
jgi:hypothetical protein